MEHLFEEYAAVDAQIKALTESKEAIRDKIIVGMADAGEDKVEASVGKFSITKLKKWTYTEKTLDIGEKFKAAKAKEESTGEATFEETDSLRFTPIKL